MYFRMKKVREQYGRAHRLEQVFILPEHKLAYVSTPKVACSSFKTLMERLHQQDPAFEVANIHERRTIPKPHKLGWKLVNGLQKDGLFGFAFVRDPAKRLASCFTNKMFLARERVPINRILGREDERGKITFDDFLTAVELQKPEEMNPHWRPQHMVLMADAIEYDFIGRMENIKADFAHIQKTAGLPADYTLPHRNKVVPRRNWVVEMNPERQRRIEAIYADDYERFSY